MWSVDVCTLHRHAHWNSFGLTRRGMLTHVTRMNLEGVLLGEVSHS